MAEVKEENTCHANGDNGLKQEENCLILPVPATDGESDDRRTPAEIYLPQKHSDCGSGFSQKSSIQRV